MKSLDLSLIENVIENDLERYLTTANYGIEKENLRVDKGGDLSLTPHPSEFGKKIDNPFIKTDFSESQVEVVTPAMDTIEEAYDFLQNLNNIVNTNIGDEYLWPQSSPAILPEESKIPLADFGEGESGRKEIEYREFLANKYGKKIQMMSGIHYNFSFKESFIEKLYELDKRDESFRDFRDKIYLKLNNKLLKYRWLLIYLTGGSPFVHESYNEKYFPKMEKVDDSYLFNESLSLRNGFCGYRNEKDFIADYSSVDNYVNYVKSLIEDKELTDPREFYTTVRPKGEDNKKLIESLRKNGIKYLEVRSIDLNPLDRNGISLDTFYITHLLMLFSFFTEDEEFGPMEQEMAHRNHESVVSYGLNKDIYLYDRDGNYSRIEETATEILDKMEDIIEVFNLDSRYREALDTARIRVNDRKETIAYRVYEGIRHYGYREYHMNLARQYKDMSKREEYKLLGFEDMELSTQILIRDSIKKGLKFEVLDKKDNFIRLSNGEKTEYIKQATKTSRDSYITIMKMENKIVTKKILEENNIRVPRGEDYSDIDKALEDYDLFKERPVVVKPKSTNFGIGITIFKNTFTKESYRDALEMAFEHGDTVLVEEFISGKEYRFIVIGDRVVGILHRVPANVKGDGISSVEELVEEKNKHYLRGKGYKTPLEKISLGKAEMMFLESQGKDFQYIPSKDEVVYLRENSNISTGGDSIDYTDSILDDYKYIALKAARTVEASFCGVDLMIDDIGEKPNSQNHAIIELNFNPAIHIHCYPYIGENRNAGIAILKELELI